MSGAPTQELRTLSGIRAALEDVGGRDFLRVRAPDGRLLLEVDEDGAIALCVPRGDLELRAAEGRVRIEGAEGVEIRGPAVVVETAHLRRVVGLLETRARRIVERSRDAYRDIEGVSQTRAGQVRVVAKKTFRAVAERLRFRAKKDAKLQGDKIYLG